MKRGLKACVEAVKTYAFAFDELRGCGASRLCWIKFIWQSKNGSDQYTKGGTSQ
jgi:hypothetical protein